MKYFAPSFFLILISTSALFAQETPLLIPGDSIPQIDFTDQFDKPSPLPAGTEKILFISDMDASKITHPLLAKEGDNYLKNNQTILISDIHKMPSLISRFVALPKMREYPYTIRLIKEEKLGDPFPRTKGQVTCIELKSDKIIKIDFFDNEQMIRKFIESQSKNKNSK